MNRSRWPLVVGLALLIGAACNLPLPDEPPVCTIISPYDGEVIPRAVYTIEATADDEDGIVFVEFFVDGTRLGRDSTSLYSVPWDAGAEAPGTPHTIIAEARDLVGDVGSDTVTVTIATARTLSRHPARRPAPRTAR